MKIYMCNKDIDEFKLNNVYNLEQFEVVSLEEYAYELTNQIKGEYADYVIRQINTASFCALNSKKKVIDEILDYIKTMEKDYLFHTNIEHIKGKSFSEHMSGANVEIYVAGIIPALTSKLNEMKGEENV